MSKEPYLHWPPGLLRTSPEGWVNEAGEKVEDEETLARIKALAVPPAWRHAWVAPNPQDPIQARGVDGRGRVQYKYSKAHEQSAANDKFHHMLLFAEGLPLLRKQVQNDLEEVPFGRGPHVTALVIRLLDLGLFRIGSPRYAAQNHTYGLTTLRKEHVSVEGAVIRFDFVGKEHVRQQHKIEDALAAKRLQILLASTQPSSGHVFQTLEDPRRPVTSASVNTYIHSFGGSSASAKVFRTWGATVIAAAVVAGADHEGTANHRDPSLYAFDAAAQALGNTPTMARSSYVHPASLALGEDPTLRQAVEAAARRVGSESVHDLFVDEQLQRAVLDALKREVGKA